MNDDRENALRNLKRWISPYTPIMYYRTNDWIHEHRVFRHLLAIEDHIREVFGSSFDIHFAKTLALVHDDAEIITDDIQLYIKENMTPAEKEELAEKERKAIPILVQRYGATINGLDYAELLLAAQKKESLEAQVVSYCDKFDGLCEAIHEIRAGNRKFLVPIEGKKKDKGYIKRIADFEGKYPRLQGLLSREHPIFLPPRVNFETMLDQEKLHTEKSISQVTGYAPYDFWIRTILSYEGNENLVTQREFETEDSENVNLYV
ncbi:HD domain-containing protein [Candidatus Woesearchaeota archaeon]|nr:HD domain-containing protein [Candidatus Woesearchaeota archaeon]